MSYCVKVVYYINSKYCLTMGWKWMYTKLQTFHNMYNYVDFEAQQILRQNEHEHDHYGFGINTRMPPERYN